MSRICANQIVSDDEGTVSYKSDDTSRITISDDWHDVKEDGDSVHERFNKAPTPNQENYLPLLETSTVDGKIEHDDDHSSNDHQSVRNQDSDDTTIISNEKPKQFFMTGQMVPGSILINERGEINDSSIATYEQPKLFALSTNSVDSPIHIPNKDDDEYDSNKNEGTSQVDQQASLSKYSTDRNDIGNDGSSMTSPVTTETGDTVIRVTGSNQTQNLRETVVSNQYDSIRSTPIPLSASQVVIEKQTTLDRMNSSSSNEKYSRIYANLDDIHFIQPAIPSQSEGVASWVSVHAPSSVGVISMSNPSDNQISQMHSSEDGSHTWKRSDWEGSVENAEYQKLASSIQSNNQESSSQNGGVSLLIVTSSKPQDIQPDTNIVPSTETINFSETNVAKTNQNDPSGTIDSLLSKARLITPSNDPLVTNSLRKSSSQERRSAFQVSKPGHSRPPLPSTNSLQSGPRSTPQSQVKLRGITVVGGDWAEYRPPSANSTASKLPSYYHRVYPSPGPSTPVRSGSCKPKNFSTSPIPHSENKTLDDVDPLPFTIDQNGVLHYRQTSPTSPTSQTVKTENSFTRIASTNIQRRSPSVSVPGNIQSYTNSAVTHPPLTGISKETKPITITSTHLPTAMFTTRSPFTITESELLDVQKVLSALSTDEANIQTIQMPIKPQKANYHQTTNYNVLGNLADSNLIVKPEPIQWSRNITPLHQPEVTPAILSNSPSYSVQQGTPINRPQSTTNSVLDQLTKLSAINYI